MEDIFHFNPYSLIFLVSLLITFNLIFMIIRRHYTSLGTTLFLIVLSLSIVNALSQFFIINTVSPEIFRIYYDIYYFTIVFIPVVFLSFTFAFINNENVLNRFWFLVAIFVPSITMLYLLWNTDLIALRGITHAMPSPWGYVESSGPFGILLTIYHLCLYIPPFILMINFLRRIKVKAKRRQVGLIIASMIFPTIGTMIFYGAFPIVFNMPPFPAAMPLTVVMIVIISYSIIKYGISVLNPVTLSSRVLQTMNEAVIAVSPSLEIEFLNSGAQKLLGYQTWDYLGASLSKIIADDSYLVLSQQLNINTPTNNLPSNQEYRVSNAEGQAIPVSLSATKVIDEDGHALGFVLVLSDISKVKQYTSNLEEKINQIQSQNITLEHLKDELQQQTMSVEKTIHERTRELREEQARFQASINSLNMGFIMISRDRQILTINGMAKRMFSLSDDSSPSSFQHPLKIFNAPLIDILEQKLLPVLNISQILEKCLTDNLIEIKDIAFENKFYRIFFNPIVVRADQNQSETIGIVILIEDITEAKVLDRSKDEFFSIASHELRTPLTAIKGFAFLIKRYYAKNLQEPRLKMMIDRIEESSMRLITMVNDFLDTSRIEQSRIRLKKELIKMPELIRDVVAEYQNVAASKNLTLKFMNQPTNLPPVFGDSDRVKQILINLIGNAIKFTDLGGIEIAISQTEDGNYLKTLVIDTGRGISERNQALLFRKFQQAGNDLYTRDATGTGLGLYISKLLTQRMGGEVTLEHSQLGHGSTFSFTLPIAK